MTERTELLEATLDTLPQGIAVLGDEREVVFWNLAATAITGHSSQELLGRPLPDSLQPLFDLCNSPERPAQSAKPPSCRGALVRAHHKLGHILAAITRVLVLRDALGRRIGTAVLFHSSESLDGLPRGEAAEDDGLAESQTDLKDRLDALLEDFICGGEPFGVLWITVDQAGELRKTHGSGACQAMLGKVGKALAQGLRPAEHIGRWGQDEFLVISHERTPALLAVHAQTLAGVARIADFRWWGDRISLTVSIGMAQAENPETLVNLLERAKAAMLSSFHAGGNRIASAPGGHSCSPS